MVTIHTTANELAAIVDQYAKEMNDLSDDQFSSKPDPKKWSKKEVLGHLIDSANSNHRRFICSQYEATPKIVYDQEFWVTANNYQNSKKENVIQLWHLANEQICEVLRTMPDQNTRLMCDTGKDTIQLHSIAWIAEDYVKHLKHHLNQILPGSFTISYP